ncbi:MAG: NAD(P)H-hydrate dehydratase [Candidatus Aenigmarchaeota archaeon]|nr:NAD(P)H-hydrate dehydratase [Candidatus Aenigmarchaeota archaeon]
MFVTSSILKRVYKKRKAWSRKGDFGKLLVIGGSKLYTGAPFLAGLAALRAGCDLVTVAAPERAADIAAKNLNLITYPLKGDFLARKHLGELKKLTKGMDAIVIGNGLGRHKETIKAVIQFLRENSLPAVIDADAIHAVAGNKKSIRNNFIITPHAGEFYALTGKKVSIEVKARSKSVKAAASGLHCTILLKGHADIISDGNKTAINKTGNVFMTKAGTGDVLAGVCGSLMAQKINPFDSACAAAYISGVAGDLATKEKKQSLLATDVIEKIPEVIR